MSKSHAAAALILIAVAAPALGGSKEKKPVRGECSSRSLSLQDCSLSHGNLHIDLSRERLRVSDGVWKNVYPVPTTGDRVVWEEVRITSVGSETFLEMRLWGSPEGELQLQKLHWHVYRVEGAKLELRLHRVIAQRRSEESKNQIVLQDRRPKLRIERTPAGLRWRHDHQTGPL